MQFIKNLSVVSLMACAFMSSNVVFAADTDSDLQILVDEIQVLAEKSRKERAADRWLQIALEDLVDKYNFPWKDSLLIEDFSDGDFRKDPAWKVSSGEYWIDRRLGLRSEVVSREIPERRQQLPAQRQSNEDIGKALIGALLQDALGGRKQQPSTPEPVRSKTETTPASIRTALVIPTTFAVEAIFSQNNRPGEAGQFEWVVMQDQQATNAYKVVLSTGDQAMLEVIRVRSGRESYLESVEVPGIDDGGEHTLSWRQTGTGEINVFLDGEEVIKVSDRPFRHGFKYLGMINRGGDFSVSGIEVLGGR